MTVPLFRIETDIAAFETGVEAVVHYRVPVTVARQHLTEQ